jgi:hypothetical protein
MYPLLDATMDGSPSWQLDLDDLCDASCNLKLPGASDCLREDWTWNFRETENDKLVGLSKWDFTLWKTGWPADGDGAHHSFLVDA